MSDRRLSVTARRGRAAAPTEIVWCGRRVPVRSVIRESAFRQRIHRRYRRLRDGVRFADRRKTVTTASASALAASCQCCKRGSWLCLWVGWRCNAHCRFCSRPLRNRQPDEPEGYQLGRPFAELVEGIVEAGFAGVSYSGGEPLLYLDDKVIPLATKLTRRKPAVQQWLNTNGILVSAASLEKLRRAGFTEVRVNLAATDFSDAVMRKLPLIRKIIGRVTVEVPAIPEVYAKLIREKLIHTIIRGGVEQVNLPELYVKHPRAIRYVRNQEVYFSSRFGLLSPTASRNLTVDIMEYVIKHQLPILVNDCSNDAKTLQNEMKLTRSG